jgi:hypothetical protein
MSSVNAVARNKLFTYEGGMAPPVKPVEQLRRAVMACLLWEDSFYESGVSIAERVAILMEQVTQEEARDILREAKFCNKLRHIPLYLLTLMAKKHWLTQNDVYEVCTRADDMTELLALYWNDGKKPVSHQLVKGLQKAFTHFDEYQLAKYNRAKTVKLRDVLRVVRPKPANDEQSALWKRVVAGELVTSDTWEVAISACGSNNSKKESEYTRLIEENKLGDLAFLRNLRKMREVGVSEDVIRNSFEGRKWNWIIPYQFISAAAHNPSLEDTLEVAMFKCLAEVEPIAGKTALLVDVSGSMNDTISGKSEVLRVDVAIGLAILLREVCKNVHIFSFNTDVKQMPSRRGFALRDVIRKDLGGGTNMWKAIREAGTRHNDLMIVITDEQTTDTGRYTDANADLLVIVNVAAYKNGVGYEKSVLHISGWSDNVITYIRNYLKREYDKLNN